MIHPESTPEIARLMEGEMGPESTTRLFSLVYDQLRNVASHKLRELPPGQTLEPTVLVHEAFLRISGKGTIAWENRRHFFFAAARAMRDVIVEHARRKAAKKRGGDHERVELDSDGLAVTLPDEDILTLHAALERLEEINPDGARLILLRFFVGLDPVEVAEMLEISPATLHRRSRLLWAWLRREMDSD